MRIDLRRGADRFVTATGGIVARHSFSFGEHYDPGNVRHGALVAVNEESLAPGAGYAEHRHQGVEIVTWVLEGTLLHADSTGRCRHVAPGTVQHLSAGAGVTHTERNEGDGRLRFLQMWLLPGHPDNASAGTSAGTSAGAASYTAVDVSDRLLPGAGWVPLVTVGPGALLHAARLAPAQDLTLPPLRLGFLTVTRGRVRLLPTAVLDAGDEARIGQEGVPPRKDPTGHRLAADDAAELLLWELSTD